jgi:ferredoxin
MRTIPIDRQLVADYPVAPFEDVLQLIDAQETIAVAPCVCRTTKKLVGEACEKPLERCFSFGSHAAYYVENKMGRYISKEEAKDIIRANEKAGLVMQPFNSEKAGGMCSCCGCCCGILRAIKMQPVPADAVKSNYYAQVDPEACTGCESCLERCQMEAVSMVDDTALIDLDRCIGCGLCVTTCPSEAMHLVKKAQDQQYAPPKSGVETYIRIAQERGKLEKLMQ